MAFPATTNVDGSNPGPNSVTLPDTVQMPVGNLWKVGQFAITLTPASVANATAAEQTFSATGIGLLTTDVVFAQKAANQAGLGIAGQRHGCDHHANGIRGLYGDRATDSAQLDCTVER